MDFLVERNKPLLGRPKYDGVLTTPAMGVGMDQRALSQQRFVFLQMVDNGGVCLKDPLACERSGRPCKSSLPIDGRKYLQPIAKRNLIVFLPVPGGDVNAARPLLQRDVFCKDDRCGPIEPGVLKVPGFQPGTFKDT